MSFPALEYDPKTLSRELQRHYISASDEDIAQMLEAVGLESLDDLYRHIPESVRFASAPEIDEELGYDELLDHLRQLSAKNQLPSASFIGDGLQNFEPTALSKEVLGLRELTTAYTPYQPERSQGTLMTHWIYQCAMSKLTGFEAINVSMYDRSTTLFEAILTSLRLIKGKRAVLLCGEFYPGDLEVLETLSLETQTAIYHCGPNADGLVDLKAVQEQIDLLDGLAGLVFSQVNRFGLLEDVDALTNLAHDNQLKAIAMVDPMQLSTGGLKPPCDFGNKGADVFVAEGQHLAIAPSGGGPGLGVFGIRFNADHKNDIRSTPGRFVGRALDVNGRPCLSQVISTREQHIRREKATSNICSNQAYLATVAGASILARGESGMSSALSKSAQSARKAAEGILTQSSARLAFDAPFLNEFTLNVDTDVAELIENARREGLHLGVDLSSGDQRLLKCSFNDRQTPEDLDQLVTFLAKACPSTPETSSASLPSTPSALLRQDNVGLPNFSADELSAFYRGLAGQNISPDNTIYPLGSCTGKRRPDHTTCCRSSR
jgi:glycine dehydrogenase